ncbi:SH3 domain-containing protein [Lewinella sp. W8]|uniref:SH3 domain-containing protein n=1 Tax=Lewinella sp. W8 TaxID=2528208 RepID=UPI0010680DE9|nr:hypothetical protein [Lewinella sp. W8]MTB52089.1 hypothetical protein [Lewinella sp. W8]
MKSAFFPFIIFSLLVSCGANQSENSSSDEVAPPQEEVQAVPVAEEPSPNQSVEASTPKNNCGDSELLVYVKDADTSGTNVRKNPGGAVILTLKGEDEGGEYMMEITEVRDGWYKVKNPIGGIEEDVDIPGGIGWIHGSVIAVDSRNYGGQTLELRDAPEGREVVGLIKEEVGGIRIKDLCGAWVKVDYRGTVGWIESEWLCGIPWTNCS